MNLEKKIKSFILLAVMLSVVFPIQELFHNHYTSDTDYCYTENIKVKDCHHKSHISKQYSEHFCFYVYISQHFNKQDEIVFSPIEYLEIATLTKTIKSLYSRLHLNGYFLRGPPLLSSK